MRPGDTDIIAYPRKISTVRSETPVLVNLSVNGVGNRDRLSFLHFWLLSFDILLSPLPAGTGISERTV